MAYDRFLGSWVLGFLGSWFLGFLGSCQVSLGFLLKSGNDFQSGTCLGSWKVFPLACMAFLAGSSIGYSLEDYLGTHSASPKKDYHSGSRKDFHLGSCFSLGSSLSF
jgi:hypothetical protein